MQDSIKLSGGIEVRTDMTDNMTVYQVYSMGKLSFSSYDGTIAMRQAVFFSNKNQQAKRK